MSEDICDKLDLMRVWLGNDLGPSYDDLEILAEAAATIRILRDTLRRADELLAAGVGAEDEGDTADWRARVREFLGERS